MGRGVHIRRHIRTWRAAWRQSHVDHRPFALQRAQYGEQPVWMGIALAALLGEIGLPGGGFGHGYASMAEVGAPAVPTLPVSRQGSESGPHIHPCRPDQRHLLEHPGGPFEYNGETLHLPDIRLVYWAGGNPFHHHQDLNRLRRAFSRPDTVVVHDPFWTATARHADIVLPSTTTLERDDVGGSHSDGYLIAMQRALDPVGEAQDDYETYSGLATRLGHVGRLHRGPNRSQWVEHIYDKFRDQVARPRHRRADLRRILGSGRNPAPAQLRKSHAARPVPGRSGCTHRWGPRAVASSSSPRRSTRFGYDDCPGHPTWLEPVEWLGGRRAGRFPLHLIANQPASRLHSQLDAGKNSQASKVAGREPIRMHPDDAAARGIADGDVVRVFNDRGACFAGAIVTPDVRPSVVNLSTGAWYDPVDPSGPAHPVRTATRTCSPPIEGRRGSRRVRRASTCSSRSNALRV